MSGYLLDSNIVSDLIRNPGGVAAQRLRWVDPADVATSVIVAGELRYGAQRRGSARLTAQLEAVLAALEILPLEPGVDHRYGALRAELERRGQTIGGSDLWIASHALALGRTVVTANVREFTRVPGLRAENWLD